MSLSPILLRVKSLTRDSKYPFLPLEFTYTFVSAVLYPIPALIIITSVNSPLVITGLRIAPLPFPSISNSGTE